MTLKGSGYRNEVLREIPGHCARSLTKHRTPPPAPLKLSRPKKAAGGEVNDWFVPDQTSEANDWFVPDNGQRDPSLSETLSDVAMQAPTGFNAGLANVAGAPVDAATWALNEGIHGINAAAEAAGFNRPTLSNLVTGQKPPPLIGDIKDPFGGSESIKRGLGYIKANPDKALPQTYAGQLARSGGEGASMMVVPEAALAGATRAGVTALAPRLAETARGIFGSSQTLPDLATSALVGAGGGAGGQAAEDVVPEPYKPFANMAGNIVGGGLTGATAVGVRKATDTAVDAAARYTRPFTEEGRERTAADTLGSRATSRSGLMDRLDNMPDDLVEGSFPTTFQATGDMGLGGLEREVATRNPVEFMQRRADQNEARSQALRNLEQGGSPADVSNAVRQQFQSIDQMTEDAVTRATQAAAGRLEALGGQGNSEAYGAALRDFAAQARAAAKERERSLWRAVDPDNRLALPVTPLQTAAEGIERSVSGSAKPINGEERDVLDTIANYRPVVPFSEITDLRSRVSAAMREERMARGETPVYARLSRLRGAIENMISGAVEYRAGQEADAVAQGHMSPENTMAASLTRQIGDWYARREAETGANAVADTGGRPSARSAAPVGSSRTPEPFRGQSSPATGDQGLPGDVPLESNFDRAARERLNTATEATRQRAETFDRGPVGTVLRPGPMRGAYRSPDSAVPAQIFKRGPTGFESVNAFRQSVGNNPAAVETLGDYAAASLRQAAMRPDGTLDPARFNTWQRAHADALRALPERADRFTDAASAAQEIEHVAAIRRDALDQYQRGAIGAVLGARDADGVTRAVGQILGQANAEREMRRLAAETRNDPVARQGLRRAVVDAIANRFISNTEAGTTGQGLLKSDQFQTFIRNNHAALAHVFSEREIASLQAIANDLQRANRSVTAVKLPGGSNTAQDTATVRSSVLSNLVRHNLHTVLGAGAGAPAAFLAGAPVGFLASFAGAATTAVLSALREAGIRKADDLIREAMLDPDLARHLLMKHAPNSKYPGMTLANYLRRNTAATLFKSIMDGKSK